MGGPLLYQVNSHASEFGGETHAGVVVESSWWDRVLEGSIREEAFVAQHLFFVHVFPHIVFCF